MTLQPEQLYALTAMGIPVWKQRSVDPIEQDLTSPNAVELTLNPASNCLLLAENSELPSLQKRLLASMLRAVNVDLAQVTWINNSQIDVINMTKLVDGQVMLVLGEDMAQKLTTNALPIIANEHDIAVLPTLSAILAQPQLKQQAWSVLKVIQPRIRLYS